ncbi:MAG: 6-pyruvoyl-tetrahydropterin synthase-related protein [Desulfatirhabdiaceae bacterium]
MPVRWPIPRERCRFWVDGILMVLILGFILCFFDLHHLFSKTISAGGDTASHYYTAQYLRDYLLPKFKISGWCPGNLAGFPMLQNYFPLPFVLMALGSWIIPLQIAFKIVSVLGIFLLPVCTYGMFRYMKQPFPIPIVGAGLSLLFLFNQGNSMWGGNIPSTLAGEFCYSIGFSLTALWLGLLYRTIQENRPVTACTVLLAVIGFCHGYTLLCAGFFSLFFLTIPGQYGSHLKKLILIHGSAILIMAFWLLPLLANLPHTTKFNMVWLFYTSHQMAKEVFPVIFWPAVAMTIGYSLRFMIQKRQNPGILFQTPFPFIWFMILISLGLYFLGYRIGVVDIRFLPFMQFFLVVSGAMLIHIARLPQVVQILTSGILVILTLLWVDSRESYIQHWIRFNTSGFEQKPLWPVFSAVNTSLAGSFQDPRVVYEHSMIHDRAGTTRAFESLPLFSGRATLEGVYIQASLSDPFIFYIQSELSQTPSTPIPDYSYSRYDLTRGIEHLRLFNVREYIVVEETTRERVKADPNFETIFESMPYTVFRLKQGDFRYVEPVRFRPVVMKTDNWKAVSYRWFRMGDLSVPLIFKDHIDEIDRPWFIDSSHSDILNLPHEPLQGVAPIKETVREEEIIVEGATIGQPLLVKMSYHPNWKVEGADRIYLASPAFMLVIPNSATVRLRYSGSWPENAGLILSLLIVILSILFHIQPFHCLRIGVERIYDSFGVRLSLVALTVILVFTGYHLMTGFSDSPQVLFQKGLDDYRQKDYNAARNRFWAIMSRYPQTLSSDQAGFHYGLCFYLEKDWQNTIHAMNMLITDYPDSPKVSEALYHIGICHRHMGQRNAAETIFQKIVRDFPRDIWAQYSQDRLREMSPS